MLTRWKETLDVKMSRYFHYFLKCIILASILSSLRHSNSLINYEINIIQILDNEISKSFHKVNGSLACFRWFHLTKIWFSHRCKNRICTVTFNYCALLLLGNCLGFLILFLHWVNCSMLEVDFTSLDHISTKCLHNTCIW